MKLRTSFLLLMMVMVLSCGQPQEIQGVEDLLKENGVAYTDVTYEGKAVKITYEVSTADQYDAQLIAEWGLMMGIASGFDYEKIVIINTINDIPITKLSVQTSTVRDFADEKITEQEFWAQVTIEAIA